MGLAIYLHIPFCQSKCTYCAFNTYTRLETLIPAFVQALVTEIMLVGQGNPYAAVDTVFLGGGTPSLLTPKQMGQILDAICQNFPVSEDVEISFEANPNDISYAYMRAVRDLGVNRVSIGMQSANDNELKLFARRHNNDDVAQAVLAARRAGFDNLNLDLIYGLPHQKLDDWAWTVEQMLVLQPEHVSMYALGVETGTPMHDWVRTGQLPAPDDDLAADMYDLASERLAQDGLMQYEISNWSRPGFECRHNLQYWRNLPYVGLGPGAHGYAGGVRYVTLLAPQRYIKVMMDASVAVAFPHTPATEEAVVVDRENEIAETLIMGLRLVREGIRRQTFRDRFGCDVLDIHGDAIRRHERNGLLAVDEQAVCLTDKGRLLSNVVFRDLVTAEA